MNSPVRMLLLEDNVLDAELLHATLETAGIGCSIVRVETEAAFRERLHDDFDLIVSDYSLPSFNGKEALTIARNHRPDLPFIFVSGTIGEEAAVESLLNGASDYVLKHKPARLIPAIQRTLREVDERGARLRAEEHLRITLSQLRNLFDNLDDVFLSFDPRSKTLLQISPACERIFGLPSGAFFSNPDFWKRTEHQEDLPILESAHKALEAGQSIAYEYRIRRADGVVRWLYAKMKPVSDEHGSVTRIDGVISDVTERKDLETKFLRTQRMESLGSLAGGIVHDLNNVLSPIVMGLEILRVQHQDAATQQTISTLSQCAMRGANLVKQILMFTRGVEGRRTSVHAGRLITELKKMLLQAFPKSVEIEVEVERDLWSIAADKTQFEQVLMNLCVNARDAMPDGGSLKIAAWNERVVAAGSVSEGTAGSPHIVIEVRDTGHGISSENLSRIFDPFFTTKDAGKGTGLGLSTVSAIVKNHGGILKVDSVLGSGTAFRVYLPALAGDARSEGEIKDTFPHGHGEGILVVDDEAAIRDLARTILETYGYRVLTAADGAEGIAKYLENKAVIRLILSDQDMPRMDGKEMIRQLRYLKANVRVVSIGGTGELSEGVDVALQKPFSTPHLLQAIHDVLRPSQAQ